MSADLPRDLCADRGRRLMAHMRIVSGLCKRLLMGEAVRPGGVELRHQTNNSFIRGLIALREIVKKFRHGRYAGNQQMIPSSGAGDVQQMALGVIDFRECGRKSSCRRSLSSSGYLCRGGDGRLSHFALASISMVMAQNATEIAPCRSTGYGRLARAPESPPRARAMTRAADLGEVTHMHSL